MAIKLRKELKNQGKVDAEVSEVTKEDIIGTFGVTKDHMLKAAEILGNEVSTEHVRNSSA